MGEQEATLGGCRGRRIDRTRCESTGTTSALVHDPPSLDGVGGRPVPAPVANALGAPGRGDGRARAEHRTLRFPTTAGVMRLSPW